MVAESFSGFLNIFQLIITVLVWLCVAINFFVGNRSQKINLIIVVIGYLAILYYVENFFAATTVMTLWFLFAGTKYFVSKEILFALYAVLIVLSFANPFFYIIAFVLYTITLSNFILSTLKQVKLN